MNVLQNVAYTAKATATGGREGSAKSDDGRLDVTLSTPKGLGGDDGQGTNPEQLFAAGYAACFIGALKFVAGQEKISLPKDTHINSEVSIGAIEGGYFGLLRRVSCHFDHHLAQRVEPNDLPPDQECITGGQSGGKTFLNLA